MATPTTSPLPRKGAAKTMDFYEALKEVFNGKRITKLEWATNDIYCQLLNGYLHIFINGKFSNWIISDGDMKGEDWVLMPEVN